jgi:hypothetical protein
VKIKSEDGDPIGVLFRYQDNNNYYRFWWAAEGGDPKRVLEKIANGIVTQLAFDMTPYVTGQSYQLQIVAPGSNLQVLVNGTTIFSLEDPVFDSGTIALYHGGVFEDVLVEDLSSGAVLLWDNFNDGNLIGWTLIDGKGTTGGPSYVVN